MEGWYRIAFTTARAHDFSATLLKIHDAQRHANWSLETSVFVTDDLVQVGTERVCVIYFPPAAAVVFAPLISEMGGAACMKPLAFGLVAHGDSEAQSLLD